MPYSFRDEMCHFGDVSVERDASRMIRSVEIGGNGRAPRAVDHMT